MIGYNEGSSGTTPRRIWSARSWTAQGSPRRLGHSRSNSSRHPAISVECCDRSGRSKAQRHPQCNDAASRQRDPGAILCRSGFRFPLLGSRHRLRLVRLRLGRLAQALDALPDPADGRLAVLELHDRGHARQSVPGGHQPGGRPLGGHLRQVLLAGEGVERRGAGRRGFRRAGEYRNVVIVVNRKGFHYPFLLWATLCAVITWITRNRMKGKGILTKKRRWRGGDSGRRRATGTLTRHRQPFAIVDLKYGLVQLSVPGNDQNRERYFDTVEVWRLSRHGPTTVFKVSTLSSLFRT